jgi:hypothetical protein
MRFNDLSVWLLVGHVKHSIVGLKGCGPGNRWADDTYLFRGYLEFNWLTQSWKIIDVPAGRIPMMLLIPC